MLSAQIAVQPNEWRRTEWLFRLFQTEKTIRWSKVVSRSKLYETYEISQPDYPNEALSTSRHDSTIQYFSTLFVYNIIIIVLVLLSHIFWHDIEQICYGMTVTRWGLMKSNDRHRSKLFDSRDKRQLRADESGDFGLNTYIRVKKEREDISGSNSIDFMERWYILSEQVISLDSGGHLENSVGIKSRRCIDFKVMEEEPSQLSPLLTFESKW